MSKSVDDAVCDYFSLLLKEPAAQVLESKSQQDVQLAETLEVNQSYSRQALELLFTRSNQVESPEVTQSQVSTESVNTTEEKGEIVVTKPLDVAVEHQVAEALIVEQEPTRARLQDFEQETAQDTVQQVEQQVLVSTQTLLEQLDEEFQVLFFNVAGLTLAVPLVSLGGIVNLDKVTRLMGRPDWYMGVQQYREAQLNIVDTCAWVMPEKYDQQLAQKVSYQYVVVLNDSAWGLGCESLVDTITIKKSSINWRTQAGKRPWLAGVVKEQMCGILNVDALIQMLDSGLGCQDSI